MPHRNEMDEVKATDVAGQLTSAKYKEVLARLRKDKHLAGDVQELVKSNSKIRRNATNIANEIGVSQKIMAGSLNDKKKQQQQQNTARELCKRSMYAKKGEIDCVIVNIGSGRSGKSNVGSYPFIPAEAEQEKWQLQPVIIGHRSFVAVCNATTITGLNRAASKLLGMDAYGPIIFMCVSEDDTPVDIELAEFKALLEQM